MAFVDGTSSVDFLDGTQFDDVVRGFDGNDTMRGLAGNDSLNGNEAEDYINGNQGNDTLRGGKGNDTILGGQGNDLILGDLGNDFLYGDRGADTLEGGDGNDLFAIGVGFGGFTVQGADVITDFRGDGTGGTPRDLIGLIRTDLNKSLDDLFNGLNITVVNGDTIIQDKATGEFLAVIDNFDRTLTSSDFNIAPVPQAIAPPSSTPTPSPTPSPTPTPIPTPSPTPGGTPTPFASVSVITTDPTAAESGTPPSDTGTFLISRDNSVGNLTVNLAISGTATNTTDYATIPTTVTIPNGSTSVIVTVSPVDDALVESTETVVLTLASSSGYTISSPSTATVSILDNDTSTGSTTPTAGPDNLTGTSASDVINGLSGNDTITGAAGADTLTGGAGSDSFLYNSATEGSDTISDFVTGVDSFRILGSGFGGGLAVGTLTSAQFLSGAGFTAATNGLQRFIYDTTTGILRFDVDGTGATASQTLATLTGLPAIANTDFTVF